MQPRIKTHHLSTFFFTVFQLIFNHATSHFLIFSVDFFFWVLRLLRSQSSSRYLWLIKRIHQFKIRTRYFIQVHYIYPIYTFIIFYPLSFPNSPFLLFSIKIKILKSIMLGKKIFFLVNLAYIFSFVFLYFWLPPSPPPLHASYFNSFSQIFSFYRQLSLALFD